MYCRNCGAEVKPDDKFCPACGSKQMTDPSDVMSVDSDYINSNEGSSPQIFSQETVTKSANKPIVFVFGIIGMVLCLVGASIGLYGWLFIVPPAFALCIVAKSISKKIVNSGLKLSSITKTGSILAKIGFIVAIFAFALLLTWLILVVIFRFVPNNSWGINIPDFFSDSWSI